MNIEHLRGAVETARRCGLTSDEALQHWQLAGGPDAGRQSEHWISIAFGLARQRSIGTD
jgi:hypothetical protein